MDTLTTKVALRTRDVTPREGEMIKPGEVIGPRGIETWTLSDRRIWNQLILNAWGDRLDDPLAEFEVPVRELRAGHTSSDRLRNTLDRLQATLVKVRTAAGRQISVQMLGHTDLSDEENPTGVLRYSFHPTLVPILRASEIYARLDIAVMQNLTSKYAHALYEEVCLRANLRRQSEVLELADLRRWLGVEDGKLLRFPDLRRFAIAPAVAEINAKSPFIVTVTPIKTGRAVSGVTLTWKRAQPLPVAPKLTNGTDSTLVPFPTGGLRYTPWEAIAREALPKPLPDLERTGSAFVDWCKATGVDLAGPAIEKTFRTWAGKRRAG